MATSLSIRRVGRVAIVDGDFGGADAWAEAQLWAAVVRRLIREGGHFDGCYGILPGPGPARLWSLPDGQPDGWEAL